MSDIVDDQSVSPKVLVAAAGLIVFALLTATLGRYANIGVTALADNATVVQARDLSFADQADGSLAVIAASDGEVIHIVEPGTGGFIRGVLRGLGRDRKLRGIGPESVFTLTRWDDGRLSLSDTATGVRIDLEPFGPTNLQSFAVLLEPEPEALQSISQASL